MPTTARALPEDTGEGPHPQRNRPPARPAVPGVDRAAQNGDDWWQSTAWRALRTLAASGQPFQAADLTALGVEDPDHPGRWGALFLTANRRGLLEPAGFVTSSRPTRAGGVTRLWVGTPLARRRAEGTR